MVVLFAMSIIVNSAVSSNLVASLIDRGLAPTFAATVAGIVRHHAAAGPPAAAERAHRAAAGAAAAWQLRAADCGLLALIVHGPVAMWIGVIVFAGGTGLTTLARPYLVLHQYGAERAGYANGVIARGQQLARAAGPGRRRGDRRDCRLWACFWGPQRAAPGRDPADQRPESLIFPDDVAGEGAENAAASHVIQNRSRGSNYPV